MFFNKIFKKKVNENTEKYLSELRIAETIYNNESFAFGIIKKIIEKQIINNTKLIDQIIEESNGGTSKEWIHSQIGNIAGDLLESGNYHVYRGVLNSTGNELFNIFKKSYDILLDIHAKDIDKEYANKQITVLKSNISRIG